MIMVMIMMMKMMMKKMLMVMMMICRLKSAQWIALHHVKIHLMMIMMHCDFDFDDYMTIMMVMTKKMLRVTLLLSY